jgi:hypothetical protein
MSILNVSSIILEIAQIAGEVSTEAPALKQNNKVMVK